MSNHLSEKEIYTAIQKLKSSGKTKFDKRIELEKCPIERIDKMKKYYKQKKYSDFCKKGSGIKTKHYCHTFIAEQKDSARHRNSINYNRDLNNKDVKYIDEIIKKYYSKYTKKDKFITRSKNRDAKQNK